MSEVRRVLLANGQYIEIVQETGTSTGSVMSQSAVTAALNAKLSNADAIKTVKAIETATSLSSEPTSTTLTHTITANGVTSNVNYVIGEMVRVPDNSSDTGYAFYQLHNISGGSAIWSVLGGGDGNTYETVTVNVTCEDGTSASGQTVYIADIPHVLDSKGTAVGKVLLGTEYTVRCTPRVWYGTPSDQTFSAQVPARTVTMVYPTLKNGAFIEDLNGNLFSLDAWSTVSHANANSVVLLSSAKNFRIALQGAPSWMQMNPNYTDPWETYLSGTTNSGITDETVAKTDYSGAVNTQLIVEKCQSSTDYAAGWCNAYTFPDGKTKGYLPALGELYLAYQNKDAINAALAKCGGTALPTYFIWSSTFWGWTGSGYYVWMISLDNGGCGGNYLHERNTVRAFGTYTR